MSSRTICVFAESQSWQAHRARAPSRSSGSSGAVGTVLSRILVVPVCYGPSRAAGSSNYIEIGQSSNWLRTDRGASLNVGASTQETSRCHGSSEAGARGTCDSSCPAGSNWNFYSWRGGGDGGCQLLWPRMRGALEGPSTWGRPRFAPLLSVADRNSKPSILGQTYDA